LVKNKGKACRFKKETSKPTGFNLDTEIKNHIISRKQLRLIDVFTTTGHKKI
jgi:hypothetical protein